MKQILIVEDDKGLNQGLCKALKTAECQTISCTNLKTAREQISCQMPDLILLDLNLPDGNGCALLRELRQEAVYVPIILLTANDTDEDIVNGLEQGADDYITKPFSLSVLRARVRNQLRKTDRVAVDTTMERVVLVDRIWTDGADYVDENALSVTVKRLRDKLGAPNYIKTVYGVGYMWVNDYE